MIEDIDAAWNDAQIGERDFHLTRPWREFARRLKAQYTSMIGIGSNRSATVIDVGCGPDSRLLDHMNCRESVALDPLTFSGDAEEQYKVQKIPRVVMAAEDFKPWDTWERFSGWDEAWCYNCLQHTRDPWLVLKHLTRYARSTVRLFEWVDVPTDRLHLHVLTPDLLRSQFDSSWSPQFEIEGRWVTPDFDQRFYAAVWRHT